MLDETPDRIIVIRAGALGDVLLTLPALHALRERHPDAVIQVVGYPAVWGMAVGLIDEVVSIDHPRFAGLYGMQPSPELLRWIAGAHLAVAWMAHDPTEALHRAGVRTIHASPYPPPGVHAAAWMLQTLGLRDDGVGILGGAAEIGGCWRDDSVQEHRGAAFIHPGAGAAWKRWPPARFAALADKLAERGLEVAIVEGPADAGAVTEMMSHSRRRYEVIREPSLRRLASILAGGSLYIGNDSGVTHLASMARVPAVALFGPTDPASWAPVGSATILRHCDRRAVTQGQIRVCEDPLCMEAISVRDVLESAIQKR